MERKQPTFTIRIRYRDFKTIKRIFPPMRNETIIDYFSRFVGYVKDYNEDIK